MLGTKLCDPCWELEHRIKLDPELARRMLAEIDRQKEERLEQAEGNRREAEFES